MKLTQKQKDWLNRRTVKVGGFYLFPQYGFTIYARPSYASSKYYLDTNPFTKTLNGDYFLVKEKIDGFCKGDFYRSPTGTDFYISESDLSFRDLPEYLFLLAVCFIPMTIYNLLNRGNNN